MDEPIYIRCKRCGQMFMPIGNRKVFCSKECSRWYFDHRGGSMPYKRRYNWKNPWKNKPNNKGD